MSRRSGRAPVLYDPDWLSLLDARERLRARGAAQAEAETAICLALQDRKFRRHWILEKATYARTGATLTPTYVRALEFEEGNKLRLAVPADLKPADIDWDNSRPLRPWPYGPWQHQLLAQVAKLTISRVDFETVFPLKASAPLPAEMDGKKPEQSSPSNEPNPEEIIRTTLPDEAKAVAKEAGETGEEASPPLGGAGRRTRASSKENQARDAILEIWGSSGIPAKVTNKAARREICKHLKIREDDMSEDTVRRAAGRRK
jgi:hypothetical protein